MAGAWSAHAMLQIGDMMICLGCDIGEKKVGWNQENILTYLEVEEL